MIFVVNIIKGDWRNIGLLIGYFLQFFEDGLSIIGSVFFLEVYDMFVVRIYFSFLWEFLYDEQEDRNYVVFVYVL